MKYEIISHPNGHQLPIVLDDEGMPEPLYNEYLLSRDRQKANTLKRNASELVVIARWVENQKIDLVEKFVKGTLKEAELRGSLIPWLKRNHRKGVKVHNIYVAPEVFNQRLIALRAFLGWVYDEKVVGMSYSSEAFVALTHSMERVSRIIDDSYIKKPPLKSVKNLGLTLDQANDLLDCVDPNNPLAYGRDPAIKHRNYVIVLLLLSTGMRPGELLSLRVEDVKTGAIPAIHMQIREPDPNDPRKDKPSVKRNARIIPIMDRNLAYQLDKYIVDTRDDLEEKSKLAGDYLILSSNGEPLTLKSLGNFFRIIRDKNKDKLPSHLSPKAMRHTFSTYILKELRSSGLDEDEARLSLAILRGDSNLDSQDDYTKQFYEDSTRNSMLSYQKRIMREEVSW
ncbi:tyrosine-type recombinase/integrase [Halomonas sp. LR5S13]|uniref:tyrosine-type recombinase/integrase n=1 Tax=Halomonas rhizosphaerae TaxID=3043296 RepID=UPI0024A9CE18|nr:site-specific integrase [Halomonas rhizosphaerae]MDI5922518.1 tyrosine-type recombinase/integrase [Halomonas rhizosphaerae]